MFYSVILKKTNEYLYIGNSPKSILVEDVCFIVRGKEQDVCDYIAKSIAEATNSLKNNYKHALSNWPNKKTHYVYILDDNSPFYVGVGVENRAKDHAKKFLKYLKENNAIELSKVKNIQIADVYHKTKNLDGLHRIIAAFEVDIRESDDENKTISKITAHAYEKFLITHFFGVNHLTNETKGDNREYETLAKPCLSNTEDKEHWNKTVVKFIDGGKLTQTDTHPLVLASLQPFWNRFLSDLRKLLLNELVGASESELELDFNGTDVGGYITFQSSPVRIHLKASVKMPAVCINLRPNRKYGEDAVDRYKIILSKIYGESILLTRKETTSKDIICNPKDEFYKPFRRGNSSKDQEFMVTELCKDSEIILTLKELIEKLNAAVSRG